MLCRICHKFELLLYFSCFLPRTIVQNNKITKFYINDKEMSRYEPPGPHQVLTIKKKIYNDEYSHLKQWFPTSAPRSP